jgi:hypothetical protein
MTKMAFALPALGLIMALSPPAAADTINLSLAASVETTAPGTTVSFVATVAAPLTNLADVYLNSDSSNVDYPLTVDDSPFFLNFPFFLAPGDSYTGVLFNVDVPTYAALDTTYQGYFEIDGGADGSASGYLASVDFQVYTAPEPQGVILLLLGLSGLAVALLRQHRLS